MTEAHLTILFLQTARFETVLIYKAKVSLVHTWHLVYGDLLDFPTVGTVWI